MEPNSLETWLNTVRAWLALATDEEVLALAALVTAELARRGLPRDRAAAGGDPEDG